MIEQKKKTLNILAFIHQKLLATHFYPEEFVAADASLEMIGEMAKRLDEELQKEILSTATEPSDEVKPESQNE